VGRKHSQDKNKQRFKQSPKEIPIPQSKKTFHKKDMLQIQPLTATQRLYFQSVEDNPESHQCLIGSAGTGKTFLALYSALTEVLDPSSPYEKLIIIRSVVSSRDVGHLPGELEEKIAPFETPYMQLCDDLFTFSKSYENMKDAGKIEFHTTSFIRGTTFHNAIVLFDEFQNESEHNISSVITRVGQYCKLYLAGDVKQSDLLYSKYDVTGFGEILPILQKMPQFFQIHEFGHKDIVRSDMVKQFIIEKENMNSLPDFIQGNKND
jgi:phosphate starvation-inducible PhoH-like protein